LGSATRVFPEHPMPPLWIALRRTLCPRRHPTRGSALRERERDGGEERKTRDPERSCKGPAEPVGDLTSHDVPETASAEEAGDRRGGNDEHSRDPHARQQKRQAERQLDPRQ